ncbi:MAG: GNAT family N-acetyltransferase [Clostridia bacterium]|nr:GNAT family N-acetyltransferase [Clostridia bacterium]
MNNVIRLAQKKDIPFLYEIWKVCFGDNEDYVDFFYKENLGKITSTVYCVDDRPVSMLHWFDAEFVNGTERRPAKYLYSGGSHPDFRKNGYYAELIQYVTDYADKHGCVLFGKPATQKLLPYYAKFGFLQDACFRILTFPPAKKVPIKTKVLTPEKYNLMRNSAFGSFPHVEWPYR